MSLVAWYPLNGNIKNQGIGDMELTQVIAPTFVNGKIGQALNKGGFTWTAEQTERILNNNELSICFWFYVNAETGSTTNRMQIFGKGGMGEGDNRKFSLLQYPNCNSLHWSWMNDTSNTTFTAGVLENVLPSYQWTHVAVTYKNPTGKIYINGELKHTFTGVSNSSSFSYPTTVIYDSQYHYLNDYRFYDHCLSVQEVKELSKALILHYPLNSQNGSGNENLLIGSGRYTESSPLVRTRNVVDGWQKETSLYTNRIEAGTYTLQAKTDGVWHAHSTSGVSPSYRYCSIWLVSAAADNDSGKNIDICLGATVPKTLNLTSGGVYYIRTNLYSNGTDDSTVRFWDIKLEKGSVATPWCPNKNDELYTKLGYNGNTEYDISGYGYDGEKVGNILYDVDTPSYDTCSNFNQTGYIKRSSFGIQSYALTMSFWLNIPETITAQHFLLGTFDNWTSNGIGIWRDTGKKSYTILYRAVGETSFNSFLTSAFTENTWYHLSLIFDGTNIKYYENGVLKRTVVYGNNGYINNPVLYLGYSLFKNASSEIDESKMSDFRIYSTALSDDDILELYQTKAKVDKNGNMYCNEFIENGYITTSNINKKYEVNTNQLNEEIDIYDMKTKMLDDGSIWARIHWLDVSSTVEWFKDADEVAHCIDKSNRYSRMELVDEFLTVDNNYEFMLTYPSLSDTLYNRWTQTSSANVGTVTGLNKITTAWTNHNYGIRKHNTSNALYDCDTGSTWFAPIGQYKIWDAANNNYIPAPNNSSQRSTELWVRIDNLKNKDLMAKIGKSFIKANQIIEI